MAQLKMYWMAGSPICGEALPEGYTFSLYKGEKDKMAWVDCCKYGLVAEDADESVFDARIGTHPFTDPYKDCIFLDYQGEHIGTITAVHHTDDNTGEMHMVGIRRDFRGKGLGKYLNAAAIRRLAADGVRFIELTTDEWRKGAVKSYLTAGFLPVEYDAGMPERWAAVLQEYNIDTIDMVDEDGRFVKTLQKKVRIGVLGAGRGRTMMNYCKDAGNAVLVAVCDSFAPALENAMKDNGTASITYYADFEKFLEHPMDAVVLANYANAHAPFAVRCLQKGLHVISEVLPVQTMQEAVELVEATEQSSAVYAYAENYCYMPAPKKMRQLYHEGVLGTFEYGEGEYMHNCEPGWHHYTRGNPSHWRNTMHACYYCTHSIGPLVHITGLRPVRVSGFEIAFNARMERMGAMAGPIGLELITLENGAVLKSVHGVGPSKNSIWYSVYGSKGRMESAREDTDAGDVQTLYVNCDKNEGDNDSKAVNTPTTDAHSEEAGDSGHGGSDFYTMYNFVEKIRGNEDADIIDVYEALNMFLPGMFAYRSVLAGGIPMEIPDLHDSAVRDKWRHDTACTDPAVAGEQLLPSYSGGNPVIAQENYDKLIEKLREEESKV